MGSVGPNYTGTGAAYNDGGTTTWSNPTNIQGDNTNTASTCAIGSNGGTSYKLRCTGFGFGLAAGATIDGITVEVEQYSANNNRQYWNNVQLLIAGSESGSNLSDGSAINNAKGFKTFGSTSEKWGLTPAYSDINNTGFGVSLKISRSSTSATTTSLYRCRITVTYHTDTAQAVAVSSTVTIEIGRVKVVSQGVGVAATLGVGAVRSTGKQLATAVSSAAGLTRKVGFTVETVGTLSAELARTVIPLPMAAVASFTTQVKKDVPRLLSVASAVGASVQKRTTRAIGVVASLVVDLAKQVVSGGQNYPQAVDAATVFVVGVVGRVGKLLAVVSTADVAVRRAIARTLPFTSTVLVAVARRIARTLGVVTTAAIAMAKRATKSLGVAATLTARLGRAIPQKVGVAVSAVVDLAAELGQAPQTYLQAVDAGVELGATVLKRVGKGIGTLTSVEATLSALRSFTQTVGVTVPVTVALGALRSVSQVIAVGVSFTVELTRGIAKLLATAGQLVVRALTGTSATGRINGPTESVERDDRRLSAVGSSITRSIHNMGDSE